jgi:hypothetical protein
MHLLSCYKVQDHWAQQALPCLWSTKRNQTWTSATASEHDAKLHAHAYCETLWIVSAKWRFVCGSTFYTGRLEGIYTVVSVTTEHLVYVLKIIR